MTSLRRLPDGVFLGSHAVAEGLLSRKQLTLYRRVLHNVYADPALPNDHRTRARGAALVMPAAAAIGGRSAASWYGADLSSATDPVVVVVPRGCPWDGPRGVRVHATNLTEDDVVLDDTGIRMTTATRTAWDVATLESTMTAVAHLDAMLHAEELGGQALLAESVIRRGQWRCSRVARIVPLTDGRAQSPPESWVRVACHLAGLPAPVPQFDVVEHGVWLGQVDLAWPEAKLIVEYEGAYHFEAEQIVKDDARYERMIAAGWRVIRLLAADLRDLDGVVARIRAALADV